LTSFCEQAPRWLVNWQHGACLIFFNSKSSKTDREETVLNLPFHCCSEKSLIVEMYYKLQYGIIIVQ